MEAIILRAALEEEWGESLKENKGVVGRKVYSLKDTLGERPIWGMKG